MTPDRDQGADPPGWINTFLANAQLRAGVGQQAQARVKLPNPGTPLYHVGPWQEDRDEQPFTSPDNPHPPFPQRWLQVELRNPDRAAVSGWVHSAVTHYPQHMEKPTDDQLRSVVVEGPTDSGNSATGPATGGTTPGDGTADAQPAPVEDVGVGLPVASYQDGQDVMTHMTRIKPQPVEGQGNGVVFYSSPNAATVGLDARVAPELVVLGLVHGRMYTYPTYEGEHHIQGGKNRRSDTWLVVEYMAATYFVHAGAVVVSPDQLEGWLGLNPAAPGDGGAGAAAAGGPVTYDDWKEDGAHLDPPGLGTPAADYQARNGFAPDERLPAGYLPASGALPTGHAGKAQTALRVAPDPQATNLPPALGAGTAVTIYGVINQQPAWFRAREGERYGWIAAADLTEAATLLNGFGATIAVAQKPGAAGGAALSPVNVINPAGADVLATPRRGTQVAHLEPGFAISQVYEAVVGQAVARPAGVSTTWLRIGLVHDSAPDVEVSGYVPALDTTFDVTIPPTSGGAKDADLVVTPRPGVPVFLYDKADRKAKQVGALGADQPMSVQWAEPSLDQTLWLRVTADTAAGTLEGFVVASSTTYSGNAPEPQVRRVDTADPAASGSAPETTTITADPAILRAHAAVEQDQPPLGTLPTGVKVTVLAHYESVAVSGLQSTDTGKSSTWLYIEVPPDRVTVTSGGAPPAYAWVHIGSTDLAHSEGLSGAPGNEGADALVMPPGVPARIGGNLWPGDSSSYVQMAKTQLVRRGFMTVTEYNVVGPQAYTDWTTQAVREFQLLEMPSYVPHYSLQDGVLSPDIWQAMFLSNEPAAHMTLTQVEAVLSQLGLSHFAWDPDNNPYAYERLGSSSYWGPGVPGGECTWFVRGVYPGLNVTVGAGAWAGMFAHVSPPQRGDVMNKATHVAVVTGVSADGTQIDVIECNWNYSRAVDTRSGVKVDADMAFFRP
ncbi:MAG TPA: CHAP domain-containing protein [Kofleriaceae bacterium]|nr:CHAP domain-containing protein [Kofleriaceae bacterium]